MGRVEKRKRLRQKEKIKELRAGREPKINLRSEVVDERPGDILGPDVKAVLRLARAWQIEEEPDAVATSWERQLRAQDFFNDHGLAATLDEIVRVGGLDALD